MDINEFRRIEYIRRDIRLHSAVPMQLSKTNIQKEKLHIVYVMTWTGICGGSKIILEHCNHLIALGHRITIVCHFARPGWFPLHEQVCFIQVPLGEVLCEYIPKCNVITATYWKEIYECVEQKIAPVVYFEQGDNHLFAPESMDPGYMKHIRKQISMAPFILTVSNYAKENIKEVFGADSAVIPNAVEKSIFYPEEERITQQDNIIITAIGSIHLSFKNIPIILLAVKALLLKGYPIQFILITPDNPGPIEAAEVIINPAQKIIGDSLRKTDIYICASQYESFCLPVLEAMTCGAAVLTTDCGGIRDFIRENENACIMQKNDIADTIHKLETLINDQELRKKLAKNALTTAAEFDWDITAQKLAAYYQDIASYQVL